MGLKLSGLNAALASGRMVDLTNEKEVGIEVEKCSKRAKPSSIFKLFIL